MEENKTSEGNKEKVIYLYLTDWQRNMVRDFTGIDGDRIEILTKHQIIMLYAVRPVRSSNTKIMYLTDFQIKEVKDKIGSTCEFIEISENLYPYIKDTPITNGNVITPKYKVPAPLTPKCQDKI